MVSRTVRTAAPGTFLRASERCSDRIMVGTEASREPSQRAGWEVASRPEKFRVSNRDLSSHVKIWIWKSKFTIGTSKSQILIRLWAESHEFGFKSILQLFDGDATSQAEVKVYLTDQTYD